MKRVPLSFFATTFVIPLALVSAAACSGDDTVVPALADAAPTDATISPDVTGFDAKPDAADARDASFDVNVPPATDFCGMPGALVFTDDTAIQIPGIPGKDLADLSFVSLPNGFCIHYYATVPAARQIRQAPGGELFVASPSESTAGGAPTGVGAVLVLPDDDKDGYSENAQTFQGNLPSTQGMLFTPGFFWYQDKTKIMRVPYTSGARTNVGGATQMVDVTQYQSPFHWPKTLDIAQDGSVYVTNGSDQGTRRKPGRSSRCFATSSPSTAESPVGGDNSGWRWRAWCVSRRW